MSPDAAPSLSVVVPCYRTPGSLRTLVDKVVEFTAPLVSSVEILLVDDGSPDRTWDAIREVAAENSHVRGIRLMRNYGQHNALLAGARLATGDLVLTIDDDLQNPPDQIPLLFEALTAEVDLVYGSPITEQQSGLRNVASRMVKRSMRIALGDAVNPRHSAFRLFRRTVIDAAAAVHDPFVSLDVVLSWATTRQVVVPVRFDVRREGTSGYSFGRLTRHAMNMITGYSVVPLRIVTAFGVAASLLGFGLAAYVLLRFAISGVAVQGFTFLASAINIFAGFQMLALGILGEYLGRVHFRSMGRPNYVVSAMVGGNAEGGRVD